MAIASYIVGSDAAFRADISRIIEAEGFEIIGDCDDISGINQQNFDREFLVVIDFPSSEEQVETVKAINSLYPSSLVVVLSPALETDTMMQCFDLGAHGYILRSLKSSALIASLRFAARGKKGRPSSVVDALDQQLQSFPSAAEAESAIKAANLSRRELNVLCCIMAGDPNKVIARRLNVCEAAIRAHVKAILRKLHVFDRTQAAIWGVSHGIKESCV